MGSNEIRPCLIGKNLDQKAVFHGWVEVSQIVPPAITVGGHGGGVVKDVCGLVELDDGTVREVMVDKIKFLDSEKLFASVYSESRTEAHDDTIRE